MKTALIGYTGFIGSILAKQFDFADSYNSKNIHTIQDKTYDLIVSVGTSSLKWKANQEGDKDWEGIQKLIKPLKTVTAKRFVLISTVDVYPHPKKITEDYPLTEQEIKQPYGRNRFLLEEFIRKQFSQVTVMRLPQVFGPGLKKNFIYDITHNNALDFTHKDSMFQWYNAEHLWQDIQLSISHNLPLINMATEPIRAEEIAQECAGIAFTTITKNPPLSYNFYSKYASMFGSSDHYLYHRERIIDEIRSLITREHTA